MKVLGIETSCDETGVGIVTDQREVLADLVYSQLDEQVRYGGVVPEVAARAHLERLDPMIRVALQQSGLALDDLDGIAVTCGPGLIGGVMVGMMAAKAIAAVTQKPFLAVNHLEGHALTPRLTEGDVAFPYLLLLVSGGHTQILVVEGVGRYKRLGTTLDDAVGECFDKSGRLLGLPWPAGAHIEKLAGQCKDRSKALEKFSLPLPMQGREGCDFSFSGLKTAVRNWVNKIEESDKNDLASALQDTVALILADRVEQAFTYFDRHYTIKEKRLVVSGGVAANSVIREKLGGVCAQNGYQLSAPPLKLCGDNGVMIAWAGIEKLRLGQIDTLDFKARPRWPLDPDAAPKIGAGVKA